MKILDLSLDTKLKEFNAQHTHTFSLAKHLSEHNELFLVIGGDKNKIDKISNFKVLTTNFNPPAQENPFLKVINLIYNNINLFFKIRRFLRNYDIIYERCRVGMLTGLFLSKIFRTPLVYEVNGILDEEMYESNYIKSKFLQKVISRLYKLQLKGADRIIVQTKELREIIKNKRGSDNISVVENGFDLIKLSAKKKDNEVKIIFVGSLDRSHNLKDILYSISKIKSRFKFFIVGEGEFREEYTKKYAYDKRFLFNGGLPHKKALGYIANSDICIASYSSEFPLFKKYGFYFCPIKLLEYSIAGKPTIMYNSPNSFTNIFESGRGCFVVNSKEEFIKKISSLIKNRGLREKMGRNAKEIARTFTWENAAKKTETVLKDALEIKKQKDLEK